MTVRLQLTPDCSCPVELHPNLTRSKAANRCQGRDCSVDRDPGQCVVTNYLFAELRGNGPFPVQAVRTDEQSKRTFVCRRWEAAHHRPCLARMAPARPRMLLARCIGPCATPETVVPVPISSLLSLPESTAHGADIGDRDAVATCLTSQRKNSVERIVTVRHDQISQGRTVCRNARLLRAGSQQHPSGWWEWASWLKDCDPTGMRSRRRRGIRHAQHSAGASLSIVSCPHRRIHPEHPKLQRQG